MTGMKKCYVKSIAQISCQDPLSDAWMDAPRALNAPFMPAVEADARQFIAPAEARRMSRILKRALCVSLSALKASGIEMPDGIVTGTGMGCIDNTERFLKDLSFNGESCLSPTLFMQSTHNTISSLIAIKLKCHGYNNTYSHGGISFDSALFDAWIQLRSGALTSVLVGAHDEATDFMALVLNKIHSEYNIVSEASVASMLSIDSTGALCEVADVRIFNDPDLQEVADYLSAAGDSALMLGTNGNPLNDKEYRRLTALLGRAMETAPLLLHFKHIFGDSPSASATGFYTAARVLADGHIPDILVDSEISIPDSGKCGSRSATPSALTIINRTDGNTWSLVRLLKA